MPLPDLLKRRSKTSSVQSPQKNTQLQRPQALPLEGVQVCLESKDQEAIPGLVTCLDDILLKNVALGYFLQYLESKGASSLMKFWMDVSSFKAANDKVSSPGTDSLDSGINLSNLTEDAVQIYQRYVSPECPYPVELSTDQKQDIVRGICAEDGQVDAGCFDAAKAYIYGKMEHEFYIDFLHSVFYAKYQLETFANAIVNIQGILAHDVLLFNFMEFMESEHGKVERALVEFWMTANNFRSEQSDAMFIYEKFISLQAAVPLGFHNDIRAKIEEAICSPDADCQVKSDCFSEAMKTVEAVLQANYLKSFLNSPLFSKYCSDLLATIEKNAGSQPPVNANQRQRSASGSSLNTTCSSETLSSIATQNISTKNTLLAATSSMSVKKKRRKSPDFLDLATQPDYLWRRKQSVLTNIGHVDHLGRYVSCLDLPPDTTTKKSVMMEPNMKTRISKAVRKIITNDDMEKLKEEMAWQMAELVITDVINRSKFPPENDEEALSTLGAPTKIVPRKVSA